MDGERGQARNIKATGTSADLRSALTEHLGTQQHQATAQPDPTSWEAKAAWRRDVLHDTLVTLADDAARQRARSLAEKVVAREGDTVDPQPYRNFLEAMPHYVTSELSLYQGDWGEVTQALTAVHKEHFAVLNMANAFCKGGGYWEGMPAQEENMWRRTDCHFFERHGDSPATPDRAAGFYPDGHPLQKGVSQLHAELRVCARGKEFNDHTRKADSYVWLDGKTVLAHPFQFYELRSAGVDTRDMSYKQAVKRNWHSTEMRKRIKVMLDTCIAEKKRFLCLSAYGCGAFINQQWKDEHRKAAIASNATIFYEEIAKRSKHFDLVAFAIYYAGYGDDNYAIFKQTWEALAGGIDSGDGGGSSGGGGGGGEIDGSGSI
jgi:hypothetical protein